MLGRTLGGLAFVAWISCGLHAEAQGDVTPASEAPAPVTAPVAAPAPVAEPAPPPAAETASTDPEKRWYIGGFYRHTWTPGFLLKPFLDEVLSAKNHGAGFEAAVSHRRLDVLLHGYWQNFEGYGPMLAKDDPPQDTEIIDSNLSVVAFGTSILSTVPMGKAFAFQFGLDIGVGWTFGNVRRTEAYPTTDRSTPGYSDGWAPCAGPGSPNVEYCEPDSVADGEFGGHYDVRIRRWTDGGKLPNVWFRFGPHLALRFQPKPWLRIRADGGFDLLSGFFAGGALAFGL